MAIDDVPQQQSVPTQPAGDAGRGIKFILIFFVLAALAVGEIYTISRVSSLRDELVTQQNQFQKQLTGQVEDQVSARLTAMEQQNAKQLEGFKTELDKAAKRVGSQGGELHKAHEMVTQLQDQQRKQAEELKQELAQKADQKQLGALTQDVSTNKTDIDATKKAVSSLTADLGMARSELGTLIARNHDDIEYLRKLGERDYFEFTVDRNQSVRVAGVSMALRKTNPKRFRYNMAVTVDDAEVERKDCILNSPIFFYVSGSKKPYEIVVNKVESNQVKGYLSTPKGVTEVAARSEGTH
jgi:hypothetical protein